MKIALLGRTRDLLTTGKKLVEDGHVITAVATAKSEGYYNCGEGEFEEFARANGAIFLMGAAINNQSAIDDFRRSGAEIGLSINWPILLKAAVCEVFRFGVINAHAGSLPRYRGNACPNWAIINGEDKIGLTLHRMDPDRLDSGPILMSEELGLSDTTYIQDVYRWMSQRIPEMYRALVVGLQDGSCGPVPQSENPGEWLRCYPRRNEDARICWENRAEEIHRLIRASSRPLDGAFCYVEGADEVRILRARIKEHEGPFVAIPGQIISRGEKGPVVACGEECLELTEIEIVSPNAEDVAKKLRSLRTRLK
jgi:methionyl-tRNA formyltransferase